MDSNKIKKDKFKVLAILAIVATILVGFIMYQGNDVTVDVDGVIIQKVSYSNTVEEFIKSENINIEEGAYISVPLNTKINDDIEFTIKNPKNYTIDVNGDLFEVKSVHTKVEDIIKDAGMELGELDYTLPEKTKEVSPNTVIELYRVTEVVEIVEEEIPFEEQVITNKNKDRGVVDVVQKGKTGLKRSEIKNEYINGVLNSSVVIKDEIVEEPVPQIVEKGTKELVIATSRGDTRYKKSMVMTATAYSASYESTGKKPGDKYYGITASGTKARPGVVAVDPRVIPLGTRLYIQSLDGTKDYGFAIAEDKGSAIKGNKIDLFFETEAECYSFGRRKVKVYVLE
jgi:3D (Asp-Asp-Asp) domain-containing protein